MEGNISVINVALLSTCAGPFQSFRGIGCSSSNYGGFCQCSLMSKCEGKPNNLTAYARNSCFLFLKDHYSATFPFQAYVTYHLKALLELCDERPDLYISIKLILHIT